MSAQRGASAPLRTPMIVVIMGVTGSGKTTIGRRLADELGWSFRDADDFHAEVSLDKMRRGIALAEDDRLPWLHRLKTLIDGSLREGRSGVLACSSLKDSHRRILADGGARVRFVYLRGTADLLRVRLGARQGHFMNPALLESQFAALEEPAEAIVVDAALTPEEIVQSIRQALAL